MSEYLTTNMDIPAQGITRPGSGALTAEQVREIRASLSRVNKNAEEVKPGFSLFTRLDSIKNLQIGRSVENILRHGYYASFGFIGTSMGIACGYKSFDLVLQGHYFGAAVLGGIASTYMIVGTTLVRIAVED